MAQILNPETGIPFIIVFQLVFLPVDILVFYFIYFLYGTYYGVSYCPASNIIKSFNFHNNPGT